MKQYTIGKKAAVIVLHQLCMILMVTGVFAKILENSIGQSY